MIIFFNTNCIYVLYWRPKNIDTILLYSVNVWSVESISFALITFTQITFNDTISITKPSDAAFWWWDDVITLATLSNLQSNGWFVSP